MADDVTPHKSATCPIPPVPAPQPARTQEHHDAMGTALTTAIREGKGSVPVEPEPLVCKPMRLESWRVFKIMSEFVEGFEMISKYALAASFFGSARCGFADSTYQAATDLAGRLSKHGFAIITGGSAGIMQAANKGAYDAGGASIGLNIELHPQQSMNPYLTDSMSFDHFFVRKVMLTFASEVYVYFPGGFGTLDEFTEILTLVQTGKIKRVPIVLYGKDYWGQIDALFRTKLYEQDNAIDESDLSLYQIVDSVDEAYDYIIKTVKC